MVVVVVVLASTLTTDYNTSGVEEYLWKTVGWLVVVAFALATW